MRVRLHPEARAEIRAARKWYDERSPLTATAFAHAVDNAISRIVEAPDQCPFRYGRTRQFVLQRFPFNLFYFVIDSEIVVVAVAHQKRRPGYWAARVSPPG